MADGRQTYDEIAGKLSLTKEIVSENYNMMKELGIITGATIHINYKIFGYKAVAHILVNVVPEQEESLIKYLEKMPEVFSYYMRGVKGNIDVVMILKTLEQFNEVKDAIKRHFSILEMRTAIWTDVKEMNQNLAIIDENRKSNRKENENNLMPDRKSLRQNMEIDEIDQKIADKLAENGRMSVETLAKETAIPMNTVKKRYQKLKRNGVLKVTIQINPNKIGYHALVVFFAVTTSEKSFSIIEKLSKIPDIISIMKTTGDYDLQIWAMVSDLNELLFIKEEIGNVPEISRLDMELLKFGDKWEKWPSPRQYISTF